MRAAAGSEVCCASKGSTSRLSSAALAAAVADQKCAIGCKGRAAEKGTQQLGTKLTFQDLATTLLDKANRHEKS